MSRLNVWAYKEDEFFTSSSIPVCDDVNLETWRRGEILWHRPLGFNGTEDLARKLDLLVFNNVPADSEQRPDHPNHVVTNLAILAHGAPGRIRMHTNTRGTHEEVTANNVHSYHGDQLREINRLLYHARDHRPLVMFLSCAAADPPRGTDLFQRISNIMRGAQVVGFTTLLTTDGSEHVELNEGQCLAPATRDTNDPYDRHRAIDAQLAPYLFYEARSLPLASPNSPHARVWFNGHETVESRRRRRRQSRR